MHPLTAARIQILGSDTKSNLKKLSVVIDPKEIPTWLGGSNKARLAGICSPEFDELVRYHETVEEPEKKGSSTGTAGSEGGSTGEAPSKRTAGEASDSLTRVAQIKAEMQQLEDDLDEARTTSGSQDHRIKTLRWSIVLLGVLGAVIFGIDGAFGLGLNDSESYGYYLEYRAYIFCIIVAGLIMYAW
jgi:hypothetical protein